MPDSYNAILHTKGLESVIVPETGCFFENLKIEREAPGSQDGLTLLWVGKFDYRKRLDIALKTIARLDSVGDIKLCVCGSGSPQQERLYKQMAKELDIEKQVIWEGQIANEEVHKRMLSADALFFTSVNEDTSTVVLEAISNGLPVICHNACGFGYVVTDDIGIKVELTQPEQSISDFSDKISYLYFHREVLACQSVNCRQRAEELSWERKIQKILRFYECCLERIS